MTYGDMKNQFYGWGRVYGQTILDQPSDKRWASALDRASTVVASLDSTGPTKSKMMDAFLQGVSEAILNADSVL